MVKYDTFYLHFPTRSLMLHFCNWVCLYHPDITDFIMGQSKDSCWYFLLKEVILCISSYISFSARGALYSHRKRCPWSAWNASVSPCFRDFVALCIMCSLWPVFHGLGQSCNMLIIITGYLLLLSTILKCSYKLFSCFLGVVMGILNRTETLKVFQTEFAVMDGIIWARHFAFS